MNTTSSRIALLAIALALHGGASAVTCTVTAAPSPLAFGSYTVLAQATANTVITLSCTKTIATEGTVSYRLRLTAGSTSGAGGINNRTMFNGAQALLYNLYTTAAFTTVFGNTAATQLTGNLPAFTAGAAGIGEVRTVNVTAFGRIVADQDLNAGAYATTAAVQVQARVPNSGGGTTYTTNLNSSASLDANCLIDSAGDIAFGTYDPLGGSDIDVSSNLVTRCTKTTPYAIALSAGGSGSFAPRKMDSAGANTDQLSYNLYTDAPRTIIWGDGTGGTSTQGGTGAGILAAAAVTRSIFGRLFSGQDLSADTYSDTVTVTVSY
jgi:spore coat protein U-like protein